MDGSYWLDAVPDLDEVYLATYASIFGDDPNPNVNKFVADYTALTGKPPETSHALTGYSVVEAMAKAIEQAGTTETVAVQAALDSFKDVDLLVGTTTFTPQSHINERPMVILKIENGKPQFHDSLASQ